MTRQKPTAVPPFSPRAGDRFALEIFGVELAFRYCPPGTFWMGSPETEARRDVDETRRQVTLTRGFWLAETPITQAFWRLATGENPSGFSENGERADDVRGLETSDFPVENVRWTDCRKFVEKLQNFAPSGLRFALPTEAQWEYACRAGTETPFSFGETLNGEQANRRGERPCGTAENGPNSNRPTPVKSYPPNAWGLCDMHGNVDEWCADYYDDYDPDDATDPTGPKPERRRAPIRVCRGGSWDYDAEYCRSAYRNNLDQRERNVRLGLRVALVPLDENERRAAELSAKKSETDERDDAANPARFDSAQDAGERRTLKIFGVEYAFRYCPPGTFAMGAPPTPRRYGADIERRRNVTLSRGFWLLETLVTQAMWESATGTNPSAFSENGSRAEEIQGLDTSDFPVERVGWNDCRKFAERLQEFAPSGWRFALPTEAQWEYACRAGTTTPFAFGKELTVETANCCVDEYPPDSPPPFRPTAVRSYPPNAWGLFDTHGNVEEWCADRYAAYDGADAVDPTGPTRGAWRIVRGGCWNRVPVRSFARLWSLPRFRADNCGFRLALVRLDENERNVPAPEEKREEPKRERVADCADSSDFNAAQRAGERRTLEIFGVERAFRYCPPGTFWMGSPETEEKRKDDETRRQVTLTRGFWLAETPTTQAMWESATGKNPSWFTIDEDNADDVAERDASEFPVDSVSWDDCREYVEKLQEFAPSGWRFALPTEAQWEYACRAGTETPFGFGESLNNDAANCEDCFPYGTDEDGSHFWKRPTKTRFYAPNAWGFYDMHGNVYEWCADWYAEYDEAAATDPTGPASGVYRVRRGGSWDDHAADCRSTATPTRACGSRWCALTQIPAANEAKRNARAGMPFGSAGVYYDPASSTKILLKLVFYETKYIFNCLKNYHFGSLYASALRELAPARALRAFGPPFAAGVRLRVERRLK